MPAALDVDREAVRVLATAVGVREAARQMGIGENTVKQWSAREGWFKQPDAVPVPATMQKQAVPNVTKPALAMGNVLQNIGSRTRIVQSKAVLKGSRAAAKLPGEAILHHSQQLKALVDSADKLHGWSKADTGASTLININCAGPVHTSASQGPEQVSVQDI